MLAEHKAKLGQFELSSDDSTLYTGFYVVDISNVSKLNVLREVHDIDAWKLDPKHHKLYALNPDFQHAHSLAILDTNKLKYGSPFKINHYPAVNRYVTKVDLDSISVVSKDEKTLYGLKSGEFRIVDISQNQAITTYKKKLKYRMDNITISSDEASAFLIEPYGGGLKIIDIRKPEYVTLLNEVNFEKGTYSVKLSPDNLKAYVTHQNGFYVVSLGIGGPFILREYTLEKYDALQELIISADGMTGYILTEGYKVKDKTDNKLIIFTLMM